LFLSTFVVWPAIAPWNVMTAASPDSVKDFVDFISHAFLCQFLSFPSVFASNMREKKKGY
jgi:hypothetical protein